MEKNNQSQEIQLKENAGIIFRIKRNRFIRGFYMFYKTFFTCSRKKFGHISDSVKIIGPTLYFGDLCRINFKLITYLAYVIQQLLSKQ